MGFSTQSVKEIGPPGAVLNEPRPLVGSAERDWIALPPGSFIAG